MAHFTSRISPRLILLRHVLALAAFTILASLPGTAGAAVTNGNFETGNLSGWTLTGSGSAQTSALGVTPPEGTYQGYIETTGNFTALAPAVATALGVSGSAIAAFGTGTPVNGTALTQTITVSAGDVLTYDWNFISDELNESATFNDFTFFTVDGAAFLLASRNSSTFNLVSPPAGFDGQTNWATGTFAFSSGGSHTIGFGVLNVGDAGHNSALLLDNITLPVPEPATGLLLPLAGILLLRRRRI